MREARELFAVDEAHAPGDLLDAGDRLDDVLVELPDALQIEPADLLEERASRSSDRVY